MGHAILNSNLLARLSTDASGNTALVVPDGNIPIYKVSNTERMAFGGRVVANYGTLTGYSSSSGTLTAVPTPAGGCKQFKPNFGTSLNIANAGAGNINVDFPVIELAGNDSNRVDYWVYVPDYTKVNGFILYLSVDAGYAAFFTKNEGAPAYNGWHRYSVLESECAVGAGVPTFETIKYGRVQVQFAAAGSCIIDRVVFGSSGTPMLTLIWDDGGASDYDYVLGLLNKYKLIGNFSIISSIMNANNVKMLAESGHRIVVHGQTALNSFGTIEAAQADIAANVAGINALGVDVDTDVYVWPNGVSMYSAGNTGLMDYLIANGFKGAFTVGGSGYPNTPSYYQKYRTHRQTLAVSRTPAAILEMIDSYAAAGLGSALMGHGVVLSGATGDQQNLADLDTVLSGIASRRDSGSLNVVSARDYLMLNNH